MDVHPNIISHSESNSNNNNINNMNTKVNPTTLPSMDNTSSGPNPTPSFTTPSPTNSNVSTPSLTSTSTCTSSSAVTTSSPPPLLASSTPSSSVSFSPLHANFNSTLIGHLKESTSPWKWSTPLHTPAPSPFSSSSSSNSNTNTNNTNNTAFPPSSSLGSLFPTQPRTSNFFNPSNTNNSISTASSSTPPPPPSSESSTSVPASTPSSISFHPLAQPFQRRRVASFSEPLLFPSPPSFLASTPFSLTSPSEMHSLTSIFDDPYLSSSSTSSSSPALASTPPQVPMSANASTATPITLSPLSSNVSFSPSSSASNSTGSSTGSSFNSTTPIKLPRPRAITFSSGCSLRPITPISPNSTPTLSSISGRSSNPWSIWSNTPPLSHSNATSTSSLNSSYTNDPLPSSHSTSINGSTLSSSTTPVFSHSMATSLPTHSSLDQQPTYLRSDFSSSLCDSSSSTPSSIPLSATSTNPPFTQFNPDVQTYHLNAWNVDTTTSLSTLPSQKGVQLMNASPSFASSSNPISRPRHHSVSERETQLMTRSNEKQAPPSASLKPMSPDETRLLKTLRYLGIAEEDESSTLTTASSNVPPSSASSSSFYFNRPLESSHSTFHSSLTASSSSASNYLHPSSLMDPLASLDLNRNEPSMFRSISDSNSTSFGFSTSSQKQLSHSQPHSLGHTTSSSTSNSLSSSSSSSSNSSSSKTLAQFNTAHPCSRALWVGHLPPHFTVQQLSALFSPFGPIDSCRILTHKQCGFVNFVHASSALSASLHMKHQTVLGYPIRIGFAKVPTAPPKQPTGIDVNTTLLTNINGTFVSGILLPSSNGPTDSSSASSNDKTSSTSNSSSSTSLEDLKESDIVLEPLSNPPMYTEKDMQLLLPEIPRLINEENKFSSSSLAGMTFSSNATFVNVDPSLKNLPSQSNPANVTSSTGLSLASSIPFPNSTLTPSTTATTVTPGSPPSSTTSMSIACGVEHKWIRQYQKWLDSLHPSSSSSSSTSTSTSSSSMVSASDEDTHPHGEEIINFILAECRNDLVPLALDYVGNTVLQKLIEKVSLADRLDILQHLASNLPGLAVHKHGTWVVQKCIELASSDLEIELLVNSLRPYTTRLLLDPFGNYVLQCCLRLQHYAQFIFDALVDHCLFIAQGKFGARAMRACLEHEKCTLLQKKQVAQAILTYSDELATHVHGTLLVTWLLDCTHYKGRYTALLKQVQLLPLLHSQVGLHLLLKLVSQRSEPEVQSLLVQSLWQSDICQLAKQYPEGLIPFLQKLVACLCDVELRNWVLNQCLSEGLW